MHKYRTTFSDRWVEEHVLLVCARSAATNIDRQTVDSSVRRRSSLALVCSIAYGDSASESGLGGGGGRPVEPEILVDICRRRGKR